MRFNLKPTFIKAVLIAFCLCSTSVLPASFEYLYIESNEGNSSGGHSAIQFGDEIYHYQHHDSGFIRLLRQDKNEFHFLYRYLQNRRIHLNHVEVSDETFKLLNEHFKLQFQAQEQQFKHLNALHKDRALLRRLLQNHLSNHDFLDAEFSSALKLKAAGLFYAEQELGNKNNNWRFINTNSSHSGSSTVIEVLRKKIEQHYGQDYLLHSREQITARIKSLTPSPWPATKPILSKDNFPPVIHSFADHYEDYLTGLVAIKVFLEEPPLRPDAFFVSPMRVTSEEKAVLERLRDQMSISLLKSINSQRPDWGYAVLVNLARIMAVDQSLQSGHWVFIDDFGIDSEWLSAEQFAQYPEQMQTQINDAKTNLLQTQTAFLSPDNVRESSYSKLEMSANRYFELLKGKQQKAVRYIGEKALPTKSVSLPNWDISELTQQQLTSALTELDNYESELLQEMAEHYQYNLITRNCVTELFKTINQALLQQDNQAINPSNQAERVKQESTQRLGGTISTDFNFIPYVSFQSVQDHYNVTASSVINSYRNQQLDKLYARNNGLMNVLRESNTFTSSVYPYNPDDAFFIFFTDDNVIVRPILGLFNTAAGLGQTVFGFISLPFDAGKNLSAGATGVLMSLPELVFFNIRKGSYKYLSYSQFINAENSKY